MRGPQRPVTVDAPVPASATARLADEAFARALEAGTIRWCRARLLRGLALAAEQEVLDEVIHELLDETVAAHLGDIDDLIAALRSALTDNGWLLRKSDA